MGRLSGMPAQHSNSIYGMYQRFPSLITTLAACALVLLSACATDDGGNSPSRAPDSPALAQAKQRVRDINWKISQTESAQRQLSPPIRTTTKGVTTFDTDKQREYEINRERLDRQIRDLRGERLEWDLRVSQIIQQESQAAQQRTVVTPGQPPAPVPMMVVPAPVPASENPALVQARYKVRDLNNQISEAESTLRTLSPPLRITTINGVTNFDAEKQRQYDMERARIDRLLRDLRADRTLWELRVNQLSQ